MALAFPLPPWHDTGRRARTLALLLFLAWPAACRGDRSAAGDTAGTTAMPTPAAGRTLDAARQRALLERNLDPAVSLPESLVTDRMQRWAPLPVGERIVRWARLFLERGDARYVFGLKPGGYVADHLLVQDYRTDCVLFTYRCTELARAPSARDAVLVALRTRFAGAPPDSVVDPTGGVDYDAPAHLDYSLDIVRSGIWGRDVTRELGVAVVDTMGTARYGAGTFAYLTAETLDPRAFHDGDLLFLVLDESSPRGARLRREYGLAIGHQGIAERTPESVNMIHAASADLDGVYRGDRIVRVDLRTYLRRVESYKGVIVTRLDAGP